MVSPGIPIRRFTYAVSAASSTFTPGGRSRPGVVSKTHWSPQLPLPFGWKTMMSPRSGSRVEAEEEAGGDARGRLTSSVGTIDSDGIRYGFTIQACTAVGDDDRRGDGDDEVDDRVLARISMVADGHRRILVEGAAEAPQRPQPARPSRPIRLGGQ